MTLNNVAPNVWCVYQPLSVPLFGNLGTRMTVVRLANQSVVLISPIKINESLKRELEALGSVYAIVAPNTLHTKYLRYARSVFPHARLCGPTALGKSRKDIPFSDLLSEKKNYQWSEEMEMVRFCGRGGFEEFIFFHKPSRTMIATDLVFNVTKPSSFVSNIALKWNRANRFGMTRLGKLLFSNRKALREGIQRLYKLMPEQIVLAHGDIVAQGGTAALKKAFTWL